MLPGRVSTGVLRGYDPAHRAIRPRCQSRPVSQRLPVRPSRRFRPGTATALTRQGISGHTGSPRYHRHRTPRGHCWGREKLPWGGFREKNATSPRLGRRSRHRELPDPELRPDQLELVLPGDLTRIGCHRVYLTSRGEIDQSIGHTGVVLQTVWVQMSWDSLSGMQAYRIPP